MKEIGTVGIVGAGTMGRRIAFACVTRGKKTRLFDVVPEVGRKAIQAVRTWIEERGAAGKLPAETVRTTPPLLETCSSLQACVSGADLVIEAVPENMPLKRQVFVEIDRYASPETLIGTNTSSIPGSQLADAVRSPGRVFNLNFGTLDHVKVEVMGHPGSTKETLETAVKFVSELGLVPIRVNREILGYATNRIWRAVKKEVLFLLNGGYISADDIDRAWMLDWGTAIGPCGLMDKIGLDVVRDIEMVYYQASGDPSDQPPPLLINMIAQGKLGVKSGQGFYGYPNPNYERPGWLTGENL